ncbi:hypothetical protein [Reichenbachiella ulvae]|uniref:Outer membrane protein beta-barrel domain-containing protein n=1 Tax=Reichenbachiella ulvae TaxID=2980104 RepID=A0ABT3CRM5_9BACT|nr:hypothetical protein [Reichenbachiella ulvae]MCV9386164.1 hypothetical protein [Reichenbachiella ulvae]
MKKYFLILLFLGAFQSLKAQETMFNLNWGIGVPVGGFTDYVEEPSFSGFSIGGRKFIYDFISVGAYTGWQLYYDKQFGLHQVSEGLDVYGRQLRHVNVYPVMASVHLYGGEDGGIRPYLGANVGLSFVNEKLQYGIWEFSSTSTNFTIAPELGIFFPVGLAGGGLNLSFKYDEAFKSSKNDYHVQSFLISIGFAMAR